MDPTGWLYVPVACQNNQPCRLHIAFHGCKQYQSYRYFQSGSGMVTFGTTFVRNAGYNKWADTNGIIVLYPQATASQGNPNGCWDWWGYDDPNYALKNGRQMAAVRKMVDRITSGHVSLPAPMGLTVIGATDVSVSLKWDTVSGAVGFNVYRNGRKVNDAAVQITSYMDQGLVPGTRYTYVVAGLTSAGADRAEGGWGELELDQPVLDGSTGCCGLPCAAWDEGGRSLWAGRPGPGDGHDVQGYRRAAGHDLFLRRHLNQRRRGGE
jgi:hypothetical protein